jgi:hypothetical protein
MRASVQKLTRRDNGATEVTTMLLTTQHAASSYGLPVLVDGHGAAIGPAELGAAVLVIHDGAVAGQAEAAGYLVALDFTEADALLVKKGA